MTNLYLTNQSNFISSNGNIDLELLKTQMQNAINNNIISISTSDSIFIVFENDLTLENETALDNLVISHNPSLKNYKITGSPTKESDLKLIQYDRIGLEKKKFPLVKGDLLEIEFYEYFNEQTNEYINLICKETNIYTYDTNKYPIKRTSTVDFYLNDGTIGYSYSFTRVYNFVFDKIEFIKIKRKNIIQEAQAYLESGILTIDQIKELLQDFGQAIYLYREGDGQALEYLITTSSREYLTQTIKDTLLGIITY